jgi:HSP20 family protein
MAIFRWGTNFDPFAGFRVLQRELERMNWPWIGSDARRVGGGAYPPINVFESEADIVVQAEVAGVDPKDLDVSITGDTLTIKGVKHPLANEEQLRFIRHERGSGEFTRTVVLPEGVEGNKVDAVLKDGVMTVRLAKAPSAKPRTIPIRPCQE